MFSRLLSPIVLLISLFVLIFIYTKVIGPIPFSVNSVTTQKSTTFDVRGQGKSFMKPDIVTVNAGISVQSQTVKNAQEQINSIINKVSEAVKQSGVDSKDIQTSNYSIYPNYDYGNGSQKINGVTANANLVIKVRNLDIVNNVIDAATSSGANQISGVTFDISDKTKVEDQARQEAVKEAKRKAEQAAQIAGFKLGRIINYSENFPGGPIALPMIRTESKAVDATPTQIEPGTSEVTVDVVLGYEIL